MSFWYPETELIESPKVRQGVLEELATSPVPGRWARRVFFLGLCVANVWLGHLAAAFGFVKLGAASAAVSGVGLLLVIFLWGLAARSSERRQLRRIMTRIGYPICIECGYDLRGSTGDTCNECGNPRPTPEELS